MKHYIGRLDARFECDADNEQDAQQILRIQLLTYVQIVEHPLVILEGPPGSAENTQTPQAS